VNPNRQNDGAPRSAPIEQFEPYALFDGDEPYIVFRRIPPAGPGSLERELEKDARGDSHADRIE
jgi:hypothetical protein